MTKTIEHRLADLERRIAVLEGVSAAPGNCEPAPPPLPATPLVPPRAMEDEGLRIATFATVGTDLPSPAQLEQLLAIARADVRLAKLIAEAEAQIANDRHGHIESFDRQFAAAVAFMNGPARRSEALNERVSMSYWADHMTGWARSTGLHGLHVRDIGSAAMFAAAAVSGVTYRIPTLRLGIVGALGVAHNAAGRAACGEWQTVLALGRPGAPIAAAPAPVDIDRYPRPVRTVG